MGRDEDLVARSLATPDGYAKVRLGMDLHPKQAGVLRALFGRLKSREAFFTGNEVGKTSRVAVAAILYAIEIRNARVQVTSGSNRQLKEQLMPGLASHAHRFPEWEFLSNSVKVDGRNRCLAYAARDAGTFQGFHASDDSPQLIICDESAAIRDDILGAAEDRCNPTWLLLMGSPLDPTGKFYRMGRELASFYGAHTLSKIECTSDKRWPGGRGWIDPADVVRMLCKNCGVSDAEAREIVRTGDHRGLVKDRLTLSTVFAEFASFVEDALLTLTEWHKCVENPPAFAEGERHAFCDFAGGRAKNVLAVRHGNKVWVEKKWIEPNEMTAVGEFILGFKRLQRSIGLRPEEIDGDGDGLGGPMVRRIQELGWAINDFHGGAKPRFCEQYADAWSEAWGEGAGSIKAGDKIVPRDADFQGQALGRKIKPASTGKLKLETKEEMRRRGLASPDEADAIFCAMMPPMNLRSYSATKREQTFHEELAEYQQNQQSGEELPGGYCP